MTVLISLGFDETESDTSNNQVFSVLVGDTVPSSAHGTTDNTACNHYWQMATVKNRTTGAWATWAWATQVLLLSIEEALSREEIYRRDSTPCICSL
jgi:hypothetical protein